MYLVRHGKLLHVITVSTASNGRVLVMRQPSESGATEMSKHKFMIQSLKVTPDKDLTTIVSLHYELHIESLAGCYYI